MNDILKIALLAQALIMRLFNYTQKLVVSNICAKSVFLCVIFIISTSYLFAQKYTNAEINNVDFYYEDENILISYDITQATSNENFYVIMEVTNQQNEEIKVSSIVGDVNKVIEAGDNKKIIWHIKKDFKKFNQGISIKITAISYLDDSAPVLLLKSALFPGIGNYIITQKKPYLLIGVTSISTFVGYFSLKSSSSINYNNYQKSDNVDEKKSYYSKANSQNKLSNYLFIAGTSIWLGNMALTYLQHSMYLNYFKNVTNGKLSVNLTSSYVNSIKPLLAINLKF